MLGPSQRRQLSRRLRLKQRRGLNLLRTPLLLPTQHRRNVLHLCLRLRQRNVQCLRLALRRLRSAKPRRLARRQWNVPRPSHALRLRSTSQLSPMPRPHLTPRLHHARLPSLTQLLSLMPHPSRMRLRGKANNSEDPLHSIRAHVQTWALLHSGSG